MNLVLTIILFIIFIATGVYISYATRWNENSQWHPWNRWIMPWRLDIVIYWKMIRKTRNRFQIWMLVIHIVSLIAAMALLITILPKNTVRTFADHATDGCSMVRLEGVTDEDWNIIQNNCDFCVRQLDAEHYLYMGETLSAKEVQALMPHNKEELRAFYLMREYPYNIYDDYLGELAAEYAIADSLDLMERFLMWSVWCDSWEYPWEVAIKIEKKHPEKFRQTIERIWDKGDIGCYEDYRNEYLRWRDSLDTSL